MENLDSDERGTDTLEPRERNGTQSRYDFAH